MGASEKAARGDGTMSQLIALGFTKYEALAYLMLLEEHPATAYEISKRGALAKGNVYTALESLVQKGAVQPVSAEPLRYAPTDPHALFGGIAKSMASVCADLAGTLAKRQRQKAIDYVWTLTGKERITDKISEIVSSARQQIWLKAPHHLLEPYAELLKAASAGGTAIVVILFGTEADALRLDLGSNAKVYLHEGTGQMLAVGRRHLTIAADFNETLIANFGDAPQAAYTRNQAVVFMAETMIRHEIYLAEIINAYGPAIERRFGKDLVSLRQKYLPPDLFKALRKANQSHAGARRSRTPPLDKVHE